MRQQERPGAGGGVQAVPYVPREYTPLNIESRPSASGTFRSGGSYNDDDGGGGGSSSREAASSKWGRRDRLIAAASLLGAGLLGALMAVLAMTTEYPAVSPSALGNSRSASTKVSIILTADMGSMAGKAECEYIMDEMTGVQWMHREMEMLFCTNVWSGDLYGQPVLLAATGIGHDRAALCLQGLLKVNAQRTKEILFLGTGGFSPARGGVLNSEDCDAPRPIVPADRTGLGRQSWGQKNSKAAAGSEAKSHRAAQRRQRKERARRLGDSGRGSSKTLEGKEKEDGDGDGEDDEYAEEYNYDDAAEEPTDVLTMIGDVCVSPMTTSWDCQKCVWPAEVDSACSVPPCSMHGQADVFGDFGCKYYTTTLLADEMIAAASTASPPHASAADRLENDLENDESSGAWKPFAFEKPPPVLQELSQRYWEAMSNGTGQPYDRYTPRDMMPKVIDYTQCAEATSNTFWVGTPYDELAREYVADVITDAFTSRFYAMASEVHGQAPARWPRGWGPPPWHNESSPRDDDQSSASGGGGGARAGSPKVTKRDVVAVSAMEGAGWMQVVALGEVYLNYSHIPAVNIRGAADYVTPPLRRRADGTWEEMSEFTEKLNGGDAMTTEGYRYAIKTTSMYTLNLFWVRKMQRDQLQQQQHAEQQQQRQERKK